MGMAKPFSHLLIAAAQHHIRTGKKTKLSHSSTLRLAGEVLAVAAGLKPAFLYDYNSAGILQILNYVQQLQSISQIGCRLHILSIADNVLIINLEMMQLWLEMLLLQNNISFIDVSASRTCPGLCDPEVVGVIKSHISDILDHIKAMVADTSQLLSSSAVFSTEWNLCTLFGVLLGYPASYSFPAQKNFDNCLSLVPLRVFTAQATLCRIHTDFKVPFYSFSVPDILYPSIKIGLDAWCEKLKEAFRAQKDFTDLCITTEVVTLTAVAL
ncbi:UPF0739 protein C1orf74 homolog [Hemicordylus capensis]|uniref:UPF0739 protein C1orf74 homolog n=1 Tax=Hemicordylus capensis TaxID=884348 RepID=UPI0023036BEC|nr:UPF0739 protein C1orf74 homolog [Hemicordylus capensis]XP_053100782.1 UPF0739 protein C1orf74 homolog [Hemicordylus capensis]XP_053100783.1 UPF0739 protein C1orf74 homolog [Hemicordylus capensis]XP_053100784.1 UPF0739 protein C1orf74 homolog [Hemicordylus capensis]